MRVYLSEWRYLYARPLWLRADVLRVAQLCEQGAERYAERVFRESVVWRPWWRRRDGRLGFGR